MSSKFFYGLSQLKSELSQEIIHSCVGSDSYEYLSLIIKYYYKNKLIIDNGLNFYDDLTLNPPFISLLSSKHCNDNWIKLILFKIWDNVLNTSKITIDIDILQTAILICNDPKWRDYIRQYADVTGIRAQLQFQQLN